MHPQPDPSRPPDTGRSFSQRLGLYLAGVAVGLMFLGWVQMRKHLSARKQQGIQQAEQQGGPAQSPAQKPDG